ncbi:hypothetical protein HAX54_000359, partial [Datura stramonium]|nr:hypothetical protein [Datura stramonium]
GEEVVAATKKGGKGRGLRCCSPATVAGNNGERGRCGWICELFPVDSGKRIDEGRFAGGCRFGGGREREIERR